MKGARSGVQRLIRNECPHVLDVGCICHLADLTVKAGIAALPVNIDQLFVESESKNFVICGAPFLRLNLRPY